MIAHTYKNGARTNQIQVNVSGLIVAPTDALLTATLTTEQVTTLKDQYDLLVALESDYQAYYRASLIVDRPDPTVPETIPIFDDEGAEIGTEPHPEWVNLNAAIYTIEAASDEVEAIATLRGGKPEPEYDDGSNDLLNQDALDAHDAALITVQALNISLIEIDQLAVAKIAAKQSIVDFIKDHTLVMTVSEADTLTKSAITGIVAAEDIESLNTFMLGIKTQAYETGLALGLI